MGVRNATVFSNALQNAPPANATETVIFTTAGLSPSIDNGQVFLMWQFSCTVGASITSIVCRIRRGITTAGTFIGSNPWATTTAAAQFLTISGWYFDTPGVVSGQQYSLTIVQTAATGASTAVDGALLAMVL
jgi:hypothetical protein